MSKKKGANFGRDEMNLLLGVAGDDSKAGIGTAGTALLQGTANRKTKSDGEVDISSMTTAQTAAMLQREQHSKGAPVATSRHRAHRARTGKRMQHHELLEQELAAQQQRYQIDQAQKAKKEEEEIPESDSEDEESDFAANVNQKRKTATKRLQMEAQIVQKTDDGAPRRRRRRQRSSSSSSSSSDSERESRRKARSRKDSSSSDESSKKARRRRRRSPSSSSTSSSEDERRRARQKKRQQLAESKKKEPEVVKKEEKPQVLPTSESAIPTQKKEKAPQPKQRQRQKDSSSSDSSSGSGSSSDSDSSSSSSSDDEPAPVMAKPLFVPKRKRLQLAQEKAEEERAAKEQEENAKNQKQKRKDESRRMVVESVMVGSAANEEVVSEDEEALASRMLDDQDDREEEKERDLWEVRELERLLTEIDILKQKEKEQAEYVRRKQLTDEQAREEDIASGRYQAPGSNRLAQNNDQPKYQQKFFHRGAYYLDEEEFEEGDVRFRAKEYERGVTESAKSRGDTRNLPQVMQVKQFGRANQSKYQGLAKEDTSSKESSMLLPLVHQKKQKGTQIPTKKRS